ncbi:predicted protein [Uncinocarpus reesii 1704]|uniref:Uncharacterized protein n=1 Tax=Uncinocarpus reesii (strain UAMH 1704) TaxID=336963 RepID=C4JGT8_UNCRE|nr:uncharacterized protein UREG_02600 [Uncinocarpus reesii 1704]EEP77751.1 predicted protein [Uncinocarpus reesii 1704]
MYLMKAQAIREMNAKMQNPETAADESAFEMSLFLITAAVTVGFFTEAQIHFDGLKKMVDYRGGVTAPNLEATPTLAVTWETQPTPRRMADRVFPPSRSPLRIVTSKLRNSPYLSDTLKVAIDKTREMIFFENFNREDRVGLTSEELELFRLRVHELEHELLDYPYRIFSKTGTEFDLNIPPVENVARLATLCYIGYNCVVAPPNSGVGRAITTHTKLALERCSPDKPTRLADDLLDMLAWAAFVGVQPEGVQLERPWFLHRLKHISMLRGWKDWNEVEEVMRGYIYVPSFHAPIWKRIWRDAMSMWIVTEED